MPPFMMSFSNFSPNFLGSVNRENSIDTVIAENEGWMRLYMLLDSGLKEALLSVLHNDNTDPTYNGLPRDPKTLYIELSTSHYAMLFRLRRRNKISNEQWDKLFPANCETHSVNFDVNLLCLVIINCTFIPPPATGWDHRKLLPTDNSKAANVLRCREWNNSLQRTDPKDIDQIVFSTTWDDGDKIIKSLGYTNVDTNSLKTMPLKLVKSEQQPMYLKAYWYMKSWIF